MKVFTVKVMNTPCEDAVKAFHERLAKVVFDNLGSKVCEQIIEGAKEKMA